MSLVTGLAQSWGSQLCSLSVQAAILIVLAYAASVCFRSFPARYRYILWLLVLVRLSIPIPITSPWGVGQYPERVFASALRWIYGTAPVAGNQSGAIAGVALSESNPNRPEVYLCFAWLVGMTLFAGAIGLRLWQIRKRRSTCVPVVRPDLLLLIAQCSGRLGLNSRIKLLQSDDIEFPSLSGAFHPSIILPSGMVAPEWTAEALEPVLIHELTHIRRRDGFVNLVQVLIQVLYFFHPMVWVANWAMRRERELACDDEVVRRYRGCPTDYVRSMLRAAETVVLRRREQLWGVAMAESYSNLGKRIRRMMHRSYGAHDRYGAICFCTAILLGFFCAGISCSSRENAEASSLENEIFMAGQNKELKTPEVLLQPLPVYTEEARKARAEGIVLLKGVIRKDGSVSGLKVIKGLGYGLDESAVNTIATKWRFKPGTFRNRPVNTQANIEVSFRLY